MDPTPVSTMDPAMYRAAMLGNVTMEMSDESVRLASFLTPQKNTILHIAARLGRDEFADEILRREPTLLFLFNSNGDTPLHEAVRYRHIDLVDIIIRSEPQGDVEAGVPIWRAANSAGNTALHDSLMNRHEEMALLLLEQDPLLANCVNNAMESPLYLAAELGLLDTVRAFLSLHPSHLVSLQGRNGQTPLHAAAIGKKLVTAERRLGKVPSIISRTDDLGTTVELLLEKVPDIISRTDVFGRTALHYCASRGNTQMAAIMLKAKHSLAYIRDNDGLTPLLVAVTSGREAMISTILEYCPDCGELRGPSGKNALHVAVESHNRPLIIRVAKQPELELINEGDDDGNTPLHLAVKNRFYSGVEIVLNYGARNNEGLTALDILEQDEEEDSFAKNGARRRLINRGAVQAQKEVFRPVVHPRVPAWPHIEKWRKLGSNLTVVAGLIATMTFTAAFTIPGGYNTDPSKLGLAAFADKAAFKIFLFLDAVAVCSSISCLFSLVLGLYRNDLPLRIGTGSELLFIALTATMIAFSIGVYLVAAKGSKILCIVIIIMCCSIPLYIFRNFPFCTCRYLVTLVRLVRGRIKYLRSLYITMTSSVSLY